MEASERERGCSNRPLAFDKMEGLVREMQDPDTGVPVRCQKGFLTSIPSAFMGYDLIEWLMDRLNIEESVEALNIGNQLCQYGYFFPVSDSRNLIVKDDSSLYRFQAPYFWPLQQRQPENVEYAIYLVKRTLRNKQRHGLEDYEMDALTSLKKNLQNKWEVIQMQAEEQVRKAKNQKKCDKTVQDSQERAFWRVNRPPPGYQNSLETVPYPCRRNSRPKRRTLEEVKREVEFLRRCMDRTRIKMSAALDSLMQYCDLYCEWDPMTTPPLPSNPWVTEDVAFWGINSSIVEVPIEKRVRRWAISMEELVSDPTGLQEFTNYLRKEYSHENIRFWLAVNDLRRSSQSQIPKKVDEIFREFLAPGAPCEVNIDGKTMERTLDELKNPSRFTFDHAAEHVYTLLLKKDCYPRFVRSELYKTLLAAGVQPSAKKRFFVFGNPVKKKANQPQALLQQQQSTAATLSQQGSLAGRRRGSDRSLSGSAHELAVSGVRDKELSRTVSHSHSQSNLSDIPYRDPPGGGSSDDVCPWEAGPSGLACSDQSGSGSGPGPGPGPAPGTGPGPGPGPGRTSRKNSSQLDSGGSSSDISIAIPEGPERLRKSHCVQQHSVSGTSSLSAQAAGRRDTRRASESIVCARPSVSSSEDLTTPQRSFDSGGPSRSLTEDIPEPPPSATPTTAESSARQSVSPSLTAAATAAAAASKSKEPLQPPTQTTTSIPQKDKAPAPAETTSKFEERGQQTGPELAKGLRQSHKDKKPSDKPENPASSSSRTSKKSHGVRKKSSSSAAPLINVSSVVDDTFDNSDETVLKSEPHSAPIVSERPCPCPGPGPSATEASGTREGAPLAEQEPEEPTAAGPAPTPAPTPAPCSPKPGTSTAPTSAPLASSWSEERGSSTEGRANEVCPWEDEESCKLDEPFTKKYSHFGYL